MDFKEFLKPNKQKILIFVICSLIILPLSQYVFLGGQACDANLKNPITNPSTPCDTRQPLEINLWNYSILFFVALMNNVLGWVLVLGAILVGIAMGSSSPVIIEMVRQLINAMYPLPLSYLLACIIDAKFITKKK